MTNLETALANLEAAQDAFSPIATELNHARHALKRSKNKTNIARFNAASDAFEAAIEVCDAAHTAVETAEVLDDIITAQAAKASEVAAQPTLF